jgi:hypothetical protein
MLIKDLFERDIFRPINGVVKADQLDESSVWQELDEFVITRELDLHFSKFVSWYLEAVDQGKLADPSAKMAVWISGFFGSGKSHFLKVISYLLENRRLQKDGEAKQAVDFFESKVKDAVLFGDIKRAVAADTDVVLFNIDAKAAHGSGDRRDVILRVFLKVLNELQGYSGDHPHIAHMERYLDGKGRLAPFEAAYATLTGQAWRSERDAYHFSQDEIVKALSETLGQSAESSKRWLDGAENDFTVSIENFCKWVKEYLDSRGPQHRIVFLVDEVGQFIGTDSHLMLNLQTIVEELGTLCRRRAWVVVTSQEDMDTVLGDMSRTRRQDFSKIQGRFYPPLSLSSANVDEVIKARLLAKDPEVKAELEAVYVAKGDILKNQLSFRDCGMTFRQFRGAVDFVDTYPFAPYQFQLIQRVFEAIRKAGASGLHLARGERSMLDAFQSAAKTSAPMAVGVLAPLYDFYPSIESFLDTVVKKTIDQAADNSSLKPFDIKLLQVLFLIRYVDEMKGNVDNLVTLCLGRIDSDRLSLRAQIEDSLGRLEGQTLIGRNGDVYTFLTSEERDINKEIKNVDLGSGEESRLLGEIIFDDVLKGQRKHRYSVNKVDFDFNRKCDQFLIGQQRERALLVSLITPLSDEYDGFVKARAILDSTADGGCVLARLGNDESLGLEVRAYLQTKKYVTAKSDGTLPETTRRILRERADDNNLRRERLTTLLGEMLPSSEFFAAGQALKLKASTPLGALDEAMEYLVQNTFNKMGYLKHLCTEPLKETQAVLRSNDIGREAQLFQANEHNPEALDDLRMYLDICALKSQQVVLHDMLEKRYSVRPYGWPDEEVLLLLARLVVLGEVSLVMDATPIPIEKVYDAISTPAKRRKVVIRKRETADPQAVLAARSLGKDLFAEMGPDGEDGLFGFLQGKLKDWQVSLTSNRSLAETGEYPGAAAISNGLTLIAPVVADQDSKKFIERFNALRNQLLSFSAEFHDLEHFYKSQKPAWERLRKAYSAFQLNRLELDKDAAAGQALKRMQEILASPKPYGAVKEADGLIATAQAVNAALLSARRADAITKIDGRIGALENDLMLANADAGLRAGALGPLQSLKAGLPSQQSLAHITQAETEAVNEYDAALRRVEDHLRAAAKVQKTEAQPPAVKKQRIVKPADLAKTTYLETTADVDAFLLALRKALEAAIAQNERIEIR